ncbi:MAG: MMPL family transporter [Lachnospiraceae bacterium]|nr:MMPL family transporter [Lachnospiraceae bacterium]
MNKFGKVIVKFKIPIIIIGFLLLIPSVIGYLNTRVNYDILSYLPEDIETMKGQEILVDEFGTGAFSLVVVNNMEDTDVAKVKEKLENVDHVSKVVWYTSFMDLSVPISALPESARDVFNSEDSTLMAVIFDDATSAESTMKAVEEVRNITNEQCLFSGMSAVVTDIKYLSNKEVPMYVVLAAIASIIVLGLTMDSFAAPVLFLLSIGMAILYNLGSNFFLDEISFITKALVAVLQLAVTMDYSIFLWHAYEEQQQTCSDHNEAMANAINETLVSITGSSITTVAGFIALCFMTYTLGMDLGVVMAKGVVIGVICCVTVLPSLILACDKILAKTSHKKLIPSLERPMKFVNRHYVILAVIFLVLLVPAIYGQTHTPVYYDLAATLPDDLQSIKANKALKEKYDMNNVSMVLLDSSLPTEKIYSMTDKIDEVKGVKDVISLESLIGPDVPMSMVPDDIQEIFKSGDYEMFIVMSEYKVGSDEENTQVAAIDKIIKSYDKSSMLVGEGPCTKDLIDITDHDFKVVSAVSIIAVFVIIAIVLQSLTLPIVLVAVIEFAIFVNMAIPYFTGTEVPFISSVVIGTIQLGATVDYAILMTTRYKKERIAGNSKKEAVSIAHVTSAESVLGSALSFFAATIGVGLYSSIDMISSLCILMSRGAIISMFTVLLILPSMLIIFDKLVLHTSLGFKPAIEADKERKASAAN